MGKAVTLIEGRDRDGLTRLYEWDGEWLTLLDPGPRYLICRQSSMERVREWARYRELEIVAEVEVKP